MLYYANESKALSFCRMEVGEGMKKEWNKRTDVVLISRLWQKNSWMLIEGRLSEELDPGTAGRQGPALCKFP